MIRLSGDAGGSSLYFHQNTYTPKGDKLIFDTRAGIAVVDISKLGQEVVGTAHPTAEPVKPEVVVPERAGHRHGMADAGCLLPKGRDAVCDERRDQANAGADDGPWLGDQRG